MALYRWIRPSAFDDDIFNQLCQFERELVNPYWRTANHLNFNSAADIGEVVNDDKSFKVKLDVSHFRPEELKVNVDGRNLCIEGNHESKTDHGTTQRSFVRRFLLPEGVDASAVISSLSDDGHLAIEAPKTTSSQARSIPIQMGSTGNAIKE